MTNSARFAALGAALLFSTGGAAIKVAAFSTAQVSGVRSGIAALVLLGWYRRHLSWTRWTAPAAFAYAATLTFFVGATRLTTAANAIFLQSTAPIYLLGLAPWLLRERVSRRDVIFLAALGAGMFCCFVGQARATVTAPNPDAGNLLGIASGVAWALTLVALRHFNRDRGRGEPGITAVIAGNAIAAAAALAWAFPLPRATAVEWATLVYLGVVQVGLAYVCLTIAMRRLPALDVSLLLLLEPVLNPVWTWIVREEVPAPWTLAGGAVILGATALRTWTSRADQGRVL
jgi:drug/metabolite transporter (DMT)-like permease